MQNAALWKLFEGQWVDSTYKLGSLIGVGGFGAVFRAEHIVEDTTVRTVAVKLIPPDPQSADRQLGELLAATNMRHAHLLTCFHSGSTMFSDSKLLYLVMELASESLQTRLDGGRRFSPEEALDLTDQLASALASLHRQHTVHRDVKPGNVLRIGDIWKLSDFGSLRLSTATTSHTGLLLGTLRYMPPESFTGVVSPGWDVWSLGVLLVESLTGEPPFPARSDQQLMWQILNETPAGVESLPPPFDDVVRRCLRKDHHTRCTAAEVSDSIRDFRRKPKALAAAVHAAAPALLPGDEQPTASAVMFPHGELATDPEYESAASRSLHRLLIDRQFSWKDRRLIGAAAAALVGFIAFRMITSESPRPVATVPDKPSANAPPPDLHRAEDRAAAPVRPQDVSPSSSVPPVNSVAVRSFATDSWQPQGPFRTSSTALRVEFDADNTVFASLESPTSIAIRDTASGRLRVLLKGHTRRIRSIQFHPTEPNLLASCGDDRVVMIWDVSKPNPSATALVLKDHHASVGSLAFTRSGTLVSAGDDLQMRFWDVHTGELIQSVPLGIKRVPTAFLLSRPVGDFLGAVLEKRINVWETWEPTLAPRAYDSEELVSTAVFSPDGRFLAATGGHRIRVWDLASRQYLASFATKTNPGFLAFHPAQWYFLASGGEDGIVRFWDLRNSGGNALVKTLSNHNAAISSLAFNRAGDRLIAGSRNSIVWIWNRTESK
jgi:serine/threonine protein kinase